jgi:hypothetical protein
MNGWNYVDGDPISSVDPSGLLPNNLTDTDFINGHYSYSCNCGFIDWDHAGEQGIENGTQTYNNIVDLYNRVKTPISGPFDYKLFFARVEQWALNNRMGGVEIGVYVKNQLPELRAKSVTAGIYLALQMNFELFQGGLIKSNEFDLSDVTRYALKIGGALNLTQSAFAIEDLTSDTIATYRVVNNLTQEEIEQMCTVLEPGDSFKIYDENRDSVSGNYRNFSLFNPVYVSSTCSKCNGEGKWPSQLSDPWPNWQERGIWEVLVSDVKYPTGSTGWHGNDVYGIPQVLAVLMGLP